jgi:ABC-type transport system involved in cytochrome c biogenesis permease subunit
MQKALPLVPSLSNWLMMHVSMMMVSYATLILGSLLFFIFAFGF